MINKCKASLSTSDKENFKQNLKELRNELYSIQQKIKVAKIPVFITVDGWSASGKGTLIGNIIDDIDPRFFDVYPIKPANCDEANKPYLSRFMELIPEAGKFSFLDSSYMNDTVSNYVCKNISKNEFTKTIHDINIFERQLVNNGYIVIKFFLDISEEIQCERINNLLQKKSTKWKVTDKDLYEYNHRKKYAAAYSKYMELAKESEIPFYVLNSSNYKEVYYQALSIINEEITKKIQNPISASPYEEAFPLIETPLLKDIPLNQDLSEEVYNKKLKELQKKLKNIHNKIYKEKIPVMICYEGWDAAGKGGNIKRLTSSLDPRGFKVNPIASPTPEEKNRHFLWRFIKKLPKNGHIAIFDRTWYGRVMVERLEGFCTENDWKRAYNEINEFESWLTSNGTIVIKFWIQIDKDTQLARFTERQNTPEKQWKITDEDWRNREKWDSYEIAINEMIQKTSTKNAPWYIIPSNNKYYARIYAIEIVIEQLENALKKHKSIKK